MSDELRVKFWGVRGSYPAPGAGTVKYGGNTASVEVRAGERTIILDAGTGIIPLGRELVQATPALAGGARENRAWVWKAVPIPKTTNKKRLGACIIRTVFYFLFYF